MSDYNFYNFKKGGVEYDSKKSVVKYVPKGAAKLLGTEDIDNMIQDPKQEYYMSIYKYNNKHKDYVDESKSTANISDVVTDKLVWDFDAKDLDEAKQDALIVAKRLVENYKVDSDDIRCYFSGAKGVHLEVDVDRELTPDEFKAAVNKIADGVKTFDKQVFDYARMFRVPNTVNRKTGLYKVQMHIADLDEWSMDQIKQYATKPHPIVKTKKVKFDDSLYFVERKQVVEKDKTTSTSVIQENPRMLTPARGWKPYKWALAQGFFDEGERHQALLIVAATCRGLGYDKETTYQICKSAYKKQAERNGQEEFSKQELWKNIIEESVFSDRWNGGQYSPKNNPWLKEYCAKYGFDEEEKEEQSFISLDALNTQFTDYARNFDQNIIKTGIHELDEEWTLSTSTLNGILGQPGSFKTGMSLEILQNASMNNIDSMFFSMDMGVPLVYAKLAQKQTGESFKSVLHMFKDNPTRSAEVFQQIKTKYANVGFNFKSGLTAQDMKNAIMEREQVTGRKTKLVIADYLECMAGPYSDPTANAGFIANQLKDVANETQTCINLLLQTQKHSTPDISDPLLSMKQIKGSSVIEQACSSVLTLWREGYSPKTTQNDKYISFALVKNRFGGLWSSDFMWNPLYGKIESMTEEQREEFEVFKKEKAGAKAAASSSTWD